MLGYEGTAPGVKLELNDRKNELRHHSEGGALRDLHLSAEGRVEEPPIFERRGANHRYLISHA